MSSTYYQNVTKPRTKWLQIAVAVGAAVALTAGVAAQSFALSDVLVSPTDTQGWTETDQRANGVSVISADQPDATGGLASLKQTSASESDKTNYRKLADFGPVSELTSLSFDWYRDGSSTAASHLTPALGLYVSDASGQNTWLLKWEGVYNEYPIADGAAPTDEWVQENIINGNFWRIPQYQNGAWVGFAGCSQGGNTYDCWNTNRHLTDEWLNGYDVVGVEVGIGSGWSGTYTSYVDNVRVGETNYNFEEATPDTSAPDVTITSPTTGGVVQGDATLAATITDDKELLRYYYFVRSSDGTNVVGPTTTYDSGTLVNFSKTVDTTGWADGTYTFQIEARDAANNKDAGSTAKVTFTVNNVVDTKEQCKVNGWATLRTADGAAFKNQGQCVAYVVSSDNSAVRR